MQLKSLKILSFLPACGTCLPQAGAGESRNPEFVVAGLVPALMKGNRKGYFIFSIKLFADLKTSFTTLGSLKSPL